MLPFEPSSTQLVLAYDVPVAVSFSTAEGNSVCSNRITFTLGPAVV